MVYVAEEERLTAHHSAHGVCTKSRQIMSINHSDLFANAHQNALFCQAMWKKKTQQANHATNMQVTLIVLLHPFDQIDLFY